MLIALAFAPGCSRKRDNEPAVATPSLSLSKDRVPIGSAVTLTYKFQVAPGASFDKNYYVFAHVLDPEGEQMWTDDHMPPTPTTSWKPGQTIEYKRTVFVPNYPYIGPAVMRLGLYDLANGRRLVLNAEEASRREYVVARFQVLPTSENIFLMYKDGWHPAEVDPKNPTTEWQWTKKTGTLAFRNPKKDCTLYLEYDARTDLFNPPQRVTLKIGDQPFAQFAADAKGPTLKTFPLTATQLGTGDMVNLSIDIDRAFAPGGGDPRELGIRVFHAYVEPK
ncbi:MAG: hypothetical protein DMF84_22375 [Acidobacteria bacterium]|nr:MAG: hypothetical protein DMF84_22375 [Acidobacteriota bacterium]